MSSMPSLINFLQRKSANPSNNAANSLNFSGSKLSKSARLSQLSLDLNVARSTIDELRMIVADRERALKASNDENAYLIKQRLDALQHEASKPPATHCYKELEEARHQVVDLIKKLNAAKESERSVLARCQDLEGQVSTLQEQLAEAEQHHVELENVILAVREEARTQLDQMAMDNKQLEKLLNSVEQANTQVVERLQSRIDLLEQERATLNIEIETQKKSMVEAQQSFVQSSEAIPSPQLVKRNARSPSLLKRAVHSAIDIRNHTDKIRTTQSSSSLKPSHFFDSAMSRQSSAQESWIGEIFQAAKVGDVVLLRKLLAKPNNVELNLDHFRDHFGRTAFMVAVENGHIVAAKLLHRPGIHSFGDKDGYTPLMKASQKGNVEAVSYLLCECYCNAANDDSFEDVDARTPFQGDFALFLAAQSGHLAVVKLLARHGANLDLATRLTGETALITAAANGYLETVCFLVSNGANVNATSSNTGETALAKAVAFGHFKVAGFLADRCGADGFNSLDIFGMSMLHWACFHGDRQRVEFLLRYTGVGLRSDLTNADGETAADIAEEGGFEEIRNLLPTSF